MAKVMKKNERNVVLMSVISPTRLTANKIM